MSIINAQPITQAYYQLTLTLKLTHTSYLCQYKLGIFSQYAVLILLFCICWQLSASALPLPRTLSLVAPSILTAWLLSNQCFIKPVQVKNLYSVQEVDSVQNQGCTLWATTTRNTSCLSHLIFNQLLVVMHSETFYCDKFFQDLPLPHVQLYNTICGHDHQVHEVNSTWESRGIMATTMHSGFNSTVLCLLDLDKALIIGYLQVMIRTQGTDMENVLRLELNCGYGKARVHW